jgi:hypothetical protein
MNEVLSEESEDYLQGLSVRLSKKMFPTRLDSERRSSAAKVLHECLNNAFIHHGGSAIQSFVERMDVSINGPIVDFAPEYVCESISLGSYHAYSLPQSDISADNLKKIIVDFVKTECDYNSVLYCYQFFSQMALELPHEFRGMALQLKKIYLKKKSDYERHGQLSCTYNEIHMEGNRTFNISGDYIENHGQVYKAPVQYNIYGQDEHIKNKKNGSSDNVSPTYKEASKLADMIDPMHVNRYQNKFNELLAPHLVSNVKDPMKVIDMRFNKGFKKNSIYDNFRVISNYLKTDYRKEDLANYMKCHIDGMPQKVDSILRYLR